MRPDVDAEEILLLAGFLGAPGHPPLRLIKATRFWDARTLRDRRAADWRTRSVEGFGRPRGRPNKSLIAKPYSWRAHPSVIVGGAEQKRM